MILQARVEVGVLQFLNTRGDPDNKHHIVRMRDFFMHRSHLCLVFELLSVNLYELVKHNQFRGLSMNLLRFFILQVTLQAILKEAKAFSASDCHHSDSGHPGMSGAIHVIIRAFQLPGMESGTSEAICNLELFIGSCTFTSSNWKALTPLVSPVCDLLWCSISVHCAQACDL